MLYTLVGLTLDPLMWSVCRTCPKPRAATSIKKPRTDGISQYYFSQKRAHGRYRPQKPDKADYLFQLGTGAPGKSTLVGAGPLGLKKHLMATVLR